MYAFKKNFNSLKIIKTSSLHLTIFFFNLYSCCHISCEAMVLIYLTGFWDALCSQMLIDLKNVGDFARECSDSIAMGKLVSNYPILFSILSH